MVVVVVVVAQGRWSMLYPNRWLACDHRETRLDEARNETKRAAGEKRANRDEINIDLTGQGCQQAAARVEEGKRGCKMGVREWML